MMVLQQFLTRRFLALFVGATMVAGALYCAQADRGLPAQHGVTNFGKVSDRLYRGAQPDAAAVTNLAQLGIKTIINLRTSNELVKGEETAAASLGLVYTNVPLRGLGRPTDEQIKTVLGLIQTLPGPVFIHCQHGCDRTGTVVACYRMSQEQWNNNKALEEAVSYGMSRLERGMRRYVLDFKTDKFLVEKQPLQEASSK